MLSVLADRTYRHLFLAQIVALLGTGLATIALGLLAYDLSGERAGLVLGTIFTIKMIAYVGIAPIAGAFANRWPRRTMLVSLDLIRAAVALCLPFVSEVWQVYILIFVLQSASAAFTPTFQATIPDILPEEDRYTRALSLSRLAYDLENIVSPMLAALLLAFVSYHTLFLGTVIGFGASALLVVSVLLPSPQQTAHRGIYERTTRGMRIYLATPRLRGLLALNLAAAAAGAMVLVNTVVLVRADLGLGDTSVAIALGAFGGGSMLAALLLPRVLDGRPDRPVMIGGAVVLVGALLALSLMSLVYDTRWIPLLAGWFIIGVGYSAVLTPSGRLLKRSAHPEDRPAVFAAQFALSHACWLVTYPLAGWLITVSGSTFAFALLAVLAGIGMMSGTVLWPQESSEAVTHSHDDLPKDHPHVQDGQTHSHPIVIDDYHPHWPRLHGVDGKTG
ncbi:MFS transporter [Antarctobacter heliothermus]|uniref:H+ Antiporter protein n=1 Tax=Antarctobacter heliothermus TaxID=74033 RepID=A0A239M0F7_9RHOB|nr:MFS transporter [Antarctobacter heliothermus]SNT36236.1 H+ Antiporter protein [Antarctobacter heliothermus]